MQVGSVGSAFGFLRKEKDRGVRDERIPINLRGQCAAIGREYGSYDLILEHQSVLARSRLSQEVAARHGDEGTCLDRRPLESGTEAFRAEIVQPFLKIPEAILFLIVLGLTFKRAASSSIVRYSSELMD